MARGRYRWRTWVRGRLPGALAHRVPKGHDCGQHEWYRSTHGTWRCYHCEAGVTHVSPFSPAEEFSGRVAALDLRVRTLAAKPLGPEVASEYRDLIRELRALLPSEPVERPFGDPAAR